MASSVPQDHSSCSNGNTSPTPTLSSSSQPPMSRLELQLKALFIRFFQTIGRWCDHYLSPPYPPSPSFTINISSTVGSVPGKIPLLFYTPKPYSRPASSNQQPNNSSQATLQEDSTSQKKYPVVINFHGGGYTSISPLLQANLTANSQFKQSATQRTTHASQPH